MTGFKKNHSLRFRQVVDQANLRLADARKRWKTSWEVSLSKVNKKLGVKRMTVPTSQSGNCVLSRSYKIESIVGQTSRLFPGQVSSASPRAALKLPRLALVGLPPVPILQCCFAEDLPAHVGRIAEHIDSAIN